MSPWHGAMKNVPESRSHEWLTVTEKTHLHKGARFWILHSVKCKILCEKDVCSFLGLFLVSSTSELSVIVISEVKFITCEGRSQRVNMEHLGNALRLFMPTTDWGIASSCMCVLSVHAEFLIFNPFAQCVFMHVCTDAYPELSQVHFPEGVPSPEA